MYRVLLFNYEDKTILDILVYCYYTLSNKMYEKGVPAKTTIYEHI